MQKSHYVSLLLIIAGLLIPGNFARSRARAGLQVQASAAECGKTVGTPVGGISYKAFEPISSLERCVWIIRVENATGYEVTIANKGFSNTTYSVQLFISSFGLNRTADHVAVKRLGTYTVDNAAFLVITFSSSSIFPDDKHTGFYLRYTAFFDGTADLVSPQSTDNIINSDIGHLKYPAAGSYSNNELSSFVFKRKGTDVLYINEDVNDGCGDSIHIYYYTAGSTAYGNFKWDYKGQVCGEINESVFSHTDLMLIIFETNDSGVGNGFRLFHSSL